jgi:hypothetical protein
MILEEDFLQRCDALSVLFHCSHGNANPRRQTITVKRAHNNLPPEQALKYGWSVTHVDHDKIPPAWDKLQLHVSELFFQIGPAGINHTPGFPLVRFVIECGRGCDLREAVHVEGLPGFLQHLNQFAARYSITDAQAGETVHFGKGPQNDDIPAVAHVLQHIGGVV